MLQITCTSDKPEKIPSDILALGLLNGKIEKNSSLDRLDKLLAGIVSQTLKKEEFKGKAGEIKVFHTHHKIKAPYVFIVGLGESKKFNLEFLRKAAGKLAQAAEGLKAKKVVFNAPETCKDLSSPEEIAQALTEGFVLGTYRFTRYKSKKENGATLSQVLLTTASSSEKAALTKGISVGQIVSQATNYTRDLINTPAADKPPEFLAREAQKIPGIRTRVFKISDLKRMGMGGILGVGKGSRFPPVLIEMVYRPSGKPKKRIALVGKGVTFDSGGLSLKPAKSMETMKDDMSAAATLLGVMKTLKALKPKVEVRAYIPSAENMPGGGAMRPGDVLKMHNGKTVEVLNTDAEGRLILADALAYAAKQKPDWMINLATLTGACLVALGDLYSAILGNNPELIQKMIDTGKKAGENLWELPLVEDYKEEMKSSVADIQNIGGPYGGTINGGLFLQEFVDDIPWAHIDIAGPSWANKPWAYAPKGGTGIMVRTLCRLLTGV
ncbi:MAG: leucyl aminopeptidase [bacterium]